MSGNVSGRQSTRRIALVFMALAAGLALSARAAEQVTLRNGFAVRCHHHAQVEDKVRLYLASGEDNFIEFKPADIAAYEPVPDPPPPAGSASASAPPQANSKLTPADLREMLARAGTVHNIDVDLLASVVKAESGGNARALSRAGARGLMQLMPGTASGLGVKDSFEPRENVRGGSIYLDSLLTRYHDNLSLALAAYNAGPEAVDRYHGIPPYRETRVYVARVIHEFNRRVLERETQARRAQTASVPEKVQP
jgi:hypothetical protein